MFSLTGGSADNLNNNNYIAYCFHSVDGYSKIGSYTGNDGVNEIVTGFRPSWIMYKAFDSPNKWWVIRDNKRGSSKRLYPNENQEENSDSNLEFLTDGFKLLDGDSYMNGPGVNYIYLAIA